MDTATVLEIIKMIDQKIEQNNLKSKEHAEKTGEIDSYYIGAYDELAKLADHLQSFIEGQLNAAENVSPE